MCLLLCWPHVQVHGFSIIRNRFVNSRNTAYGTAIKTSLESSPSEFNAEYLKLKLEERKLALRKVDAEIDYMKKMVSLAEKRLEMQAESPAACLHGVKFVSSLALESKKLEMEAKKMRDDNWKAFLYAGTALAVGVLICVGLSGDPTRSIAENVAMLLREISKKLSILAVSAAATAASHVASLFLLIPKIGLIK